MREPILVTGAAGFIGFHLARRLAADGWSVLGIDNLNDYYDPRLKQARLAELKTNANFRFEKCDVADRGAVARLFATEQFAYVAHLAAQAGVAHSAVDPDAYVDANLVGICQHSGGMPARILPPPALCVVILGLRRQPRMPLRASDRSTIRLAFTAQRKRANELMAHAYSHLFALPTTGLRFFTVYGPWGRPDMAMWMFTAAILDGRPLRLFNSGKMRRDFTYIDDVIEAMVRLITAPPDGSNRDGAGQAHPAGKAPWRIYNVGNSRPIEISELVNILEKVTGKRAARELLPMRPIDVLETCANSSDLERATGFAPNTPIEDGLRSFVEWFRDFRRHEM